jgi:nicotinamidase-related amidase
MSSINFHPGKSAVLLIDLQEKFLSAIHEADRVRDRCLFLCRIAQLLDIPILASEQYPERMGGTEAEFLPFITNSVRKMEFSAASNPEFLSKLSSFGRTQCIVVGIETHICVSQTCLGLQSLNYEVAVCPDAVSARTNDRHKLGMERLRDAGIVPVHTEAIAYEWMHSADDSRFREMLTIVKSAQF